MLSRRLARTAALAAAPEVTEKKSPTSAPPPPLPSSPHLPGPPPPPPPPPPPRNTVSADDVAHFLAESQPLSAAEAARRQAQRENLKLLKAKTRTGYAGVRYKELEQHPFKAWIADKSDRIYHLGYFASAEEAALAVARKRAQLETEGAADQATATGSASDTKAGAQSIPSGAAAAPTLTADEAQRGHVAPSLHAEAMMGDEADGGSEGGKSCGEGGESGGEGGGGKRKKRKMTATHREAIRRCKARARQRKLGLEVAF